MESVQSYNILMQPGMKKKEHQLWKLESAMDYAREFMHQSELRQGQKEREGKAECFKCQQLRSD